MVYLKMFKAFLNVQVILAILVVCLLGFFSGCQYGKSVERKSNEAEKLQTNNTALKTVRKQETKINESQNNVSANYEKEMAALRDRANSAEYQLDRLRVKARTCPSVPTGDVRGKPNATAEATTVGFGTVEINLDDVAKQIKQLGVDLDEANAKIVGLQAGAKVCEEATKAVE